MNTITNTAPTDSSHDERLAGLAMTLCVDPRLATAYELAPLRVLAAHGIELAPGEPTPDLLAEDALDVDRFETFAPDAHTSYTFTWRELDCAA